MVKEFLFDKNRFSKISEKDLFINNFGNKKDFLYLRIQLQSFQNHNTKD